MKNQKAKNIAEETINSGATTETRYCAYLKKGTLADGDYTFAIERIYVKALEREEIRFALFKKTQSIHRKEYDKLIPRPLDVSEEELFELFKNAIDSEVFTKDFLKKLKSILS